MFGVIFFVSFPSNKKNQINKTKNRNQIRKNKKSNGILDVVSEEPPAEAHILKPLIILGRPRTIKGRADPELLRVKLWLRTFFCEASHSHSHLILDPGSACYDDAGGGFAPSSVIGVGRFRIQDQVAVAVAVGGVGLWLWLWLASRKDFLITSKKIS